MDLLDIEKCYIAISSTNTENDTSQEMNDSKTSSIDHMNRHNEESINVGKIKHNPNLIYSKEDNKRSIVKKVQPNVKQMNKIKPNETRLGQTENIKAHSELQELRRFNYHLRQEKINLEEENALLKLEKEKSVKIKETENLYLQERLSKCELEIKNLTEVNEFSKKRLDEYTPKVWKYDELYEKYTKLSSDYEKVSEQIMTLSNLLSTTKKEQANAMSNYENLKVENEALKNDKFYLSRETMCLNEKLSSSNDKIRQLEDDMREIRRTNQSYIEKLSDVNLNMEKKYTEKVNEELSEMKKRYERDLENLKKQFEELSDRKCSYLQEERDEYKSKLSKLEKLLKDKEEAREFLSSELRTVTKQTDEEMAYLKIQIKMKSEELERVTNLYSENVQLIQLLKNENEAYKEKNDAIRCELIKNESDYRTHISELKAQLSMLKEKLNSYEQIENELDKVIVESSNILNDDKYSDVLGVIKDIPTSSKRRISQCLILANKLKVMTIELEQKSDLNEKLTKELKSMTEERDLLKNIADQAKQPYSYLIKNLQNLELENYKKNVLLEEKEKYIHSLLKENELLVEKVNGMQADMKAILNNRQKLESIEEIISRFISADEKLNLKLNNHHKSSSYNNTMNSYNLHAFSTKADQMMSLSQFPEKENANSNKVPSWYIKLKTKNK